MVSILNHFNISIFLENTKGVRAEVEAAVRAKSGGPDTANPGQDHVTRSTRKARVEEGAGQGGEGASLKKGRLVTENAAGLGDGAREVDLAVFTGDTAPGKFSSPVFV